MRCKKNTSLLSDNELAELLKAEDTDAWEYVMCEIVRQEEMSMSRSIKRAEWGVSLKDLMGELYEDMIGRRKLWNYKCEGSLIGWMRSYLRGYLNRRNPNDKRFSPLDGEIQNNEGGSGITLEEKIAKEMSDGTGLYAYKTEDLEVLRHERLDIAAKCFADLWRENSVQAYVMLLRARFQMSSLETTKRLGISSVANCDQMFARAIKKMKELRSNHEC